MFIKTSKTKSNETLYLAESYRNAVGKSTSRIVEKLGTIKELSKVHEDPRAWAEEYAKTRTAEERQRSSIVKIALDPDTELEMGKRKLFNCGYLFLQALFHQLRLDQLCDNMRTKSRSQFNLNSILSRLLYGRILFPGSKMRTVSQSQSLMEPPDFDLHQVYRALDILAEKSDRIQQFVYRNSKEICKRRDGILYYDCSNFYTEAEEPAGLRQYGKSKENRAAPIVEMGLFMDASGIPLAFSVWPGNTNEQVTLKPLEEKIIRDFGHAKFVVCTDAGLSSAANRRLNDVEDRAFITTQSVKKLRAYLRDWALDPDGWKIDQTDRDGELSARTYNLETVCKEENLEKYYDKVFYKERWIKQDSLEQRLIVTFSLKYMRYQRKVRNRQIERAEKMISERPESLKKKNAHDCRRFVKETPFTGEGEVAENKMYAIDEAVIQKEEMFDGYYAVCTNLEDGIEQIVRINKGRWEIEECFRISKSLLDTRPIYVWLDQHIEAHFLICFLALLLFRLLEQIVERGSNAECTAERLFDTLRDYQVSKQESAQGYCWIPQFTRTELTDALEQLFGIVLARQVLTKKMMRANIKQSKSQIPIRAQAHNCAT